MRSLFVIFAREQRRRGGAAVAAEKMPPEKTSLLWLDLIYHLSVCVNFWEAHQEPGPFVSRDVVCAILKYLSLRARLEFMNWGGL